MQAWNNYFNKLKLHTFKNLFYKQYRQCTHNVTLRGVRDPKVSSMKCACVILSSVYPLYNIFPFFLLTARFSKKLMSTKYVFWFSLQILSEIFIILRRVQRGITTNVPTSSYKVSVIRVRIEWNLNFPEILIKNTQISNFMKICQVGA